MAYKRHIRLLDTVSTSDVPNGYHIKLSVFADDREAYIKPSAYTFSIKESLNLSGIEYLINNLPLFHLHCAGLDTS